LIDAPLGASHPGRILKVQRDTQTGQEVLTMRTLTKGLVAGAVGLAVLVPGGLALADDGDSSPTPVCTTEERQERLATHDRLRAEIVDQLREEGVTDPDQIRTRLHDAMEQEYGEMPGPHAGMGPGDHGRQHRTGPRDGTGAGHGHMAS
jgi:hypothetical protein